MEHKLPVKLDPFRSAAQGLTVQGVRPIHQLPRLCASLADSTGTLTATLVFGVDKSGLSYVDNTMRATVKLRCERCMEDMSYDLSVDSLLGIVKTEKQMEQLASQYEPWMIDEIPPVFLNDMLEDELILSLPLIAKHKEACVPSSLWQVTSAEEEPIEVVPEKESPFAALAALKKDS